MYYISRVMAITFLAFLSNLGLAIAGSHIGISELYAEEDRPQEYCLALNMYFESRGSSVADMAGVSDVVLNRVKDARYPNTICEVIRQGPVRESWKTKQDADLPESERIYNPVRHKCQFSWYCDGKQDIPRNQDLWHLVQNMAYLMIWEKKYLSLIHI